MKNKLSHFILLLFALANMAPAHAEAMDMDPPAIKIPARDADIIVCDSPNFDACPANISVNTSGGSCSETVVYLAPASGIPAPSLTYVLSGATTGSGTGTGSGTSFNKGLTTVTITATNGCAPDATCVFTVTVSDNVVPVITACPSAITVTATPPACGASVTWTEPVITDNCSGVTLLLTSSPTPGLTNGSFFPVGTTTVTYSVNDAEGNTALCQFNVTVSGICPGVTELTNAMLMNASNFVIGQQRDAVCVIENISSSPNTTPVEILINKPASSFFSLAVPTTDFVPGVNGIMTTNNSDWEITDLTFAYRCKSKAGITINPGTVSIIGMKITANGPSATINSSSQITGQLLNNTAGDKNTNNNFAQLTFIIN